MKSERCKACGRTVNRSTIQNARYWALLHKLEHLLVPDAWTREKRYYSADVWHLHLKKTFLGCEDVRLPDGSTVPMPVSSATLDKVQFSNYLTAVEAFAAEHGVTLDSEEEIV